MSFRRRGLTGQLDHRRFQQADVEFAIYVKPIGTRGQHFVRPVGGGPDFRAWAPIGYTYSPGTQVPLGSNAGMRDRFIINPGGAGGGPPNVQEEIIAAPARRVANFRNEDMPSSIDGTLTGPEVYEGEEGEFWSDSSGNGRNAFCGGWMRYRAGFMPSGSDALETHGNLEVFDGYPVWTGSLARCPLGFAVLAVIRINSGGDGVYYLGGASMDNTGVYRNGRQITGAHIIGTGSFHLVEVHRSNQGAMSVFIDSVDVTIFPFTETAAALLPDHSGYTEVGDLTVVTASYIAEVSYWSGGMTPGQMIAERAALMTQFGL